MSSKRSAPRTYVTVSNVRQFLIGSGLLSPEVVVAGDVVVLDASGAKPQLQGDHLAGPGPFVKQMREMQADVVLTLRREAACYDLARTDPARERLMPRLISYDRIRARKALRLGREVR